MVVRVRDRAGLVADHEHRVQLSVETLVDEHLHGDAAVEQCRGRHARRDRRRRRARPLATARSSVHVGGREVEQVAVARVAQVERRNGSMSGGGPRKNVSGGWSAPRGPRRRHLDPLANGPRCATRAARRPGSRRRRPARAAPRGRRDRARGRPRRRRSSTRTSAGASFDVAVLERDQRQSGVRRAGVARRSARAG